jgi:hypothetical protein
MHYSEEGKIHLCAPQAASALFSLLLLHGESLKLPLLHLQAQGTRSDWETGSSGVHGAAGKLHLFTPLNCSGAAEHTVGHEDSHSMV